MARVNGDFCSVAGPVREWCAEGYRRHRRRADEHLWLPALTIADLKSIAAYQGSCMAPPMRRCMLGLDCMAALLGAGPAAWPWSTKHSPDSPSAPPAYRYCRTTLVPFLATKHPLYAYNELLDAPGGPHTGTVCMRVGGMNAMHTHGCTRWATYRYRMHAGGWNECHAHTWMHQVGHMCMRVAQTSLQQPIMELDK